MVNLPPIGQSSGELTSRIRQQKQRTGKMGASQQRLTRTVERRLQHDRRGRRGQQRPMDQRTGSDRRRQSGLHISI